MKRPYRSRKIDPGKRSLNLSMEQLAGIGSVAVSYNRAETAVDRVLSLALDLPVELHQEVLTRINGTEGKITIIKKAAKAIGLPEGLLFPIADTLGENGFAKLKSYRDGIIHARVVDADLGIGEVMERRARH